MYTHAYLLGLIGCVVSIHAISHKQHHYPDSRAQDHEDIYAMVHFFKDRQTGVILESGALDGMLFSTSFMFEKRYGWKAIHIEAAPDNFAALVRNRPESTNINAALCANTSYVHYIYPSRPQANAISGIVEFMSPTFLAYWWPIGSSGNHMDRDGFPAQITAIKCDRLGNILKTST